MEPASIGQAGKSVACSAAGVSGEYDGLGGAGGVVLAEVVKMSSLRIWAFSGFAIGLAGCSASEGLSPAGRNAAEEGGLFSSPGVSSGTGGSSSSTGGSSSSAGYSSVNGDASLGAPANEDDSLVAPEQMGGATNGPELFATNPFVRAAHDPLSTFAADVDTASYDLYRTYVANATLPPASQVRLEEFVNSFSYDYPSASPEAGEPFAIHLEAAPNLVGRDTTILRVGIQGKIVPPSEKKPANIVFLADVSGSMSGSLPLVKTVIQSTVAMLDATDTVSLVTYAGNFATPLPATPVSETTAIQRAVDSLQSGGGTNGEGGIHAAYAQAESVFIEDGINHIVILTDGDFNIGISDSVELEKLIVDKRKSGITLTVLGFGHGNTNDDLMSRLSRSGNGIYGYIGSADDAKKYVADRMLQTLQHIAKDMKLQVEFNPALVYAYRLLGYEDRAIADDDFRDDVVDAGEIGSGHRVTALYELVFDDAQLPSGSGAPMLDDGPIFDDAAEVAPEDLVLVKVRYKDPGASETDPAREVSASLDPGGVFGGLSSATSDLQWAVAVASFAEVLKASPYADPDKLGAMSLIIQAQAERDEARAEFARLFEGARALLQL